ncbi:hypothetical protein MMC18_004868 [Xylographa bjoerkii]|nr:hypothetical protein [Xylographa bjoerkii]
MTGLEIMAVVGAVAAVVSAYNDGSELVKKVRERRRTRRALENAALLDNSTQDLEHSLDTGQARVRMTYDYSYQRFKETFATGDQEALNTLKDIIIHLQGQVIGNLKVAWQHDDSTIDFMPLQNVSDDSQSRAIICLTQLHQRLLLAAPITEMRYSPPHPPQSGFHGSIESVSRQQTGLSQLSMSPTFPLSPSRSSTATTEVENRKPSRFPFGRKPKTIVEHPQPQIRGISPTDFNGFPPALPPKDEFADGTLMAGLGLGVLRTDKTPLDVSRVSSVSTGSSFSIEPDQQDTSPFYDPWKDTSSLNSRRESQSSKQSPSFSFGPDTMPEHTSSLGNRISQSSHQLWAPPQAQYSSLSKRSSRASDNSLQLSTVQSSSSTNRPSLSTTFAPQGTPVAQQVVKPRTTGGLRGYLPAEDNDFAGFCNAAWKLQIGEKKKAFEEIKRVSSIYNASSFWKCKKCHFEGRMMRDARGHKSIDTRVYGANGILYRWEFLFKSHVQLKDALPTMDSTFGCIFCCVEGKGTPIFGGMNNFLAHMQEHRGRPPTGEVVLTAIPVLFRSVAFAFPSTYLSNDILANREVLLPGYEETGAVQIGAREADPYACAGACSHAESDVHQRSLFDTALTEREIATRDVYEILKRDPSASNSGKVENGIKAGAKAAKNYLKSPVNDLGLAGDVLSLLPIPGVEEAGFAIKGVSVAEKAEKVTKAAEYARKGLKAAHKVNDVVGKANDVVGKVQDVQSNVQTAQQVVGQVKQSMQGKKHGHGKAKRRDTRRALDAIVFLLHG